MQYIYKINSLNSIVNTIPASSTEEEYLTSYGTTLYDNISKNCSSSSCYKIIDTLTLTDSQISNYCASGVLNVGGRWNISDSTTYNKLSIINNQLILDNSTKIDYVICFDINLTNSNVDTVVQFFTKIIKDSNFSFVKNFQILKNTTYSYDNYIKLISLIYKNCKQNNIKIISPNIEHYSSEWLKNSISKGILNYVDIMCFDFVNSVNDAIYSIDDDLVTNIISICKNKEIYFDIGFTTNNNVVKYYKDITSALKLYEIGFIPIINCLWDYLENDKSLLGLDFNDNNNFKYYNFVFSELNNYITPSVAIKMYDNIDVDSCSFSDGSNNVLSVIWSSSMIPGSISIIANPNEYCKNINSSGFMKVSSSYEFDNNDGLQFLIVKQQAYNDYINYDELDKEIMNKYILQFNHINSLLGYLPSTYNKDLDCTNIYKILRALSIEMAEFDAQRIITQENNYLTTVHEQEIYDNFGVLAQLNHKYNWSLEKYRALISGVIKSILTGPTLKSIEDAVNLFINYEYSLNNGDKVANITIEELYKDDSVIPTNYNKLMSMFTFIVYVENLTSDNPFIDDDTTEDVKSVIDILRPAHTLAYLQTTYTRDEYYRDWYLQNRIDEYGNNKNFENADELELQYTVEIDDNYNDMSLGMFKIFGYNETFSKGVYNRTAVGSVIAYDGSSLDTKGVEQFTKNIDRITINTTINYDVFPLAMRNKIQEKSFTLN